jgi:hypothetical protein
MLVTFTVGHQFPPLRATAQPRVGEDLRRRPTRTVVYLRPARVTTGLRLNFPSQAVGADVHVTTPTQTAVPVPPVALDSHPLTV